MILETILKIMVYAAISFEGIAAFCSIVFFNRYRKSWLAFLPVLLIYAFIVDLYGAYIYNGIYKPLIYNIAAIITFTYYILLYQRHSLVLRFKKIILFGLIGFYFSVIGNMFLQNVLIESHMFSYFVGAIVVVISAILYFVELLNKSKAQIIKYDLLFWVSIGLLLFYVGYPPIKYARIYLTNPNDYFDITRVVQLFLIIIMNICFILGFIWTRKK